MCDLEWFFKIQSQMNYHKINLRTYNLRMFAIAHLLKIFTMLIGILSTLISELLVISFSSTVH